MKSLRLPFFSCIAIRQTLPTHERFIPAAGGGYAPFNFSVDWALPRCV